MGERINWANVPETQRLACGCVIIRSQLMVSDGCTSPIGHPVLAMAHVPDDARAPDEWHQVYVDSPAWMDVS